ncbi:MAG: hypothetical protein CO093_00395 [Alphaproteobacteria bacterium CG_4_9_14_3_um_filter_47_13]|nr:MAG: hypothetical protein CO093_00395 [Alphaproteobacteria bacterium CG_4_9_14_3_um_filter_47_13]
MPASGHIILTFLFLLLLGMSGTVSSIQAEEFRLGTDESQKKTDQVQTFFNNCVKRPVIKESEETDIAFCSCAAAHLQGWLDKPLAESSGKAPLFGTMVERNPDTQTLTTSIYGPCLYIPIHDRTYDDCFYMSEKRYFANEPYKRRGFCSCLAEGEADYFKNFAEPFLELKASQKKEVIDPIEAIKRDTNYYDARYLMEGDCYIEWTNKK